MKSIFISIITMMSLLKPLSAETTIMYATEAQNWCEQAKINIVSKLGESVDCQKVSNKRCVKMNNYWCQKHGNDPWQGTPQSDGFDGLRDVDGHAIFVSGEWSARAIAIDLRSKYKKGKKTAVAIASAYSPWCDTLGSKAVVQGHGRSCSDGRAKPPKDFVGPFCHRPDAIAPTRSDCQPGCNCPPEVAEALIKGLDIDVNTDLKLFDKNGNPNSKLGILMKNLAIQEQSVRIVDSVIEAGIKKLQKTR